VFALLFSAHKQVPSVSFPLIGIMNQRVTLHFTLRWNNATALAAS
jgi:hypothetical protein